MINSWKSYFEENMDLWLLGNAIVWLIPCDGHNTQTHTISGKLSQKTAENDNRGKFKYLSQSIAGCMYLHIYSMQNNNIYIFKYLCKNLNTTT